MRHNPPNAHRLHKHRKGECEMKYSVKVLHTYAVGNKKFYETSILLTDADSFDEAYEKAERFVAQNNDEYTNIKGEAVKTEKVELLDCFCTYD